MCTRLYVLSLFSWGVASTTCQPPYPGGRSGRDIHTSFHVWQFQQESRQFPSGPLIISSPSLVKYLSTVREWFVSCAETQLVTERHGNPKARHTKEHVLIFNGYAMEEDQTKNVAYSYLDIQKFVFMFTLSNYFPRYTITIICLDSF